MKQYGLIGQSLSHSFSQQYFEEKFQAAGISDCQYGLFELTNIQEFPLFLQQHPNLQGFNVTIPYKRAIIPFLDQIDPIAEQVGAVNTVHILRREGESQLVGYNTDVEGFSHSLNDKIIPNKALILGTGGAAAAVAFALRNLNIEFLSVSRTAGKNKITYNALSPKLMREYRLIVNCTPVGMVAGEKPNIPYDEIGEQHFLYDLIYNPKETDFLKEGKKRKAVTFNGLSMLHKQAEAAWRIWQRSQI